MNNSPAQYAVLFGRGARLHPAAKAGLKSGMQFGYAVRWFENEFSLRKEVTQYSYSNIIRKGHWKVGTSAVTDVRLPELLKIKIDQPEDVWRMFLRPYEWRASKYQGDVKAEVAGHCEFMTKAIAHFINRGTISFLMIPLLHGWPGTVEELERHLSWMVTKAGGFVVNDKNRLKEKKRMPRTKAKLVIDDDYAIDKLVPLPPTLKKLDFTLHPRL